MSLELIQKIIGFLGTAWRFARAPNFRSRLARVLTRKNWKKPGDRELKGLLFAEQEGNPLASEIIDERWGAMQTDPQIQSLAGMMYAIGQKVERDVVRAHAWMSNALNHGAPVAFARLRNRMELYMTADQIKAAKELAPSLVEHEVISEIERVRRAVDRVRSGEKPPARDQLPRLLMAVLAEGSTDPDTVAGEFENLYPQIPSTPTQRAAFLEPLAQRGNPVPQLLLGLMYSAGNGTEKDIERGKNFLAQVFDNGDAGQAAAAQALYDANQDSLAHIEARRNPSAMTYLVIGLVYGQFGPLPLPPRFIFSGVTVKPDLVRAYAWISLSASHGGKPPVAARELETLLTPEQLIRAKELAKSLQEQYPVQVSRQEHEASSVQ